MTPERTGEGRRPEHPPPLADLAEARSLLYSLASDLYAPVEAEGAVLAAADELRSRFDAIRSFPFASRIDRLLAAVDSLTEREQQELAAERIRLFELGAHGHLPPFESAQLDPSGFDRGPLTVAVERAYAESGIALATGNELPDHLAVELEFMAFLCEEEADAWRAQAEEAARSRLGHQRRFLEQHLLRWAPGFLRLVEQIAPEPSLYRATAGPLRAFLLHERDLVDALLGQPGSEARG